MRSDALIQGNQKQTIGTFTPQATTRLSLSITYAAPMVEGRRTLGSVVYLLMLTNTLERALDRIRTSEEQWR